MKGGCSILNATDSQGGPGAIDYFPHRAIGYACNPFRALSIDEEAALAVLPPAVLDAFEGSSAHLQILGERGRGKSATLLGLAAHAESGGLRVAYEYLPEDADRFQADLATLDLFVLDEAQRLGRRERSRLLDAASGKLRLVVSSHANLSAAFARQRLPLQTIRLGGLGAEHARSVIERRLEQFALGDRPRATLASDAFAWLAATFGDDLRATITLLYEVFQALSEPVAVDAERLRTVSGAAPGRTAGSGPDRGPSARRC